MSSSKKYLGGALAALLALFAAVVVATPAIANEVKPLEFTEGGWVFTNTDDAGANVDDIITTGSGTVIIGANSATENITVGYAGSGTLNPLVVDSNYGGEITFNGLNVTIPSAAGVSAEPVITFENASAVLNILQSNSITSEGGATIVALSDDVTSFAIGGSGSLAAKTNSAANPVIALGDTQITAKVAIGDAESTPTITLENTSASLIEGADMQATSEVTIANGASVTGEITQGGSGYAVNLGSGCALNVNGALSVAAEATSNNGFGGIDAGAIAVGATGTPGGSVSVSITPQAGSSASHGINGTSLTITGGEVSVDVSNGGTLGVNGIYTSGAVKVTDGGSIEVGLNGGTGTGLSCTGLTVGSPVASSVAATTGTVKVEVTGGTSGNAIHDGGTTTCEAGSITATSSNGTGIDATTSVVSNGGNITATGGANGAAATYGINAGSTGLTVNNKNGQGNGPTVVASVPEGAFGTSAAILGTNPVTATSIGTAGTSSTYYAWLAQSGVPSDADNPVLVRGFAGMNGDATAATAYPTASSTAANWLPGSWFQIAPNPVTSLGLTVAGVASTAAAGTNGYMVANTVNTFANIGAASNGYVYTANVVPTQFENEVPNFASGVYGPALGNNGITLPTGTNPALSTVTNDASQIFATNNASGLEMTLTPSRTATVSNSVFTALYPRLRPTATDIPMSYQISFHGNVKSNGNNVTLSPAGIAGGTASSDGHEVVGIYLTIPGEGVLVGGKNPEVNLSTNKNMVVKSLPTATYSNSPGNNRFIGWWESTATAAAASTVTTQVAMDQVSGWEKNTNLWAQYGETAFEGLEPTPLNVARGGSNAVTLTVTLSNTTPCTSIPNFDLNSSAIPASINWAVVGPNRIDAATGNNQATVGQATQNGVTIKSGSAVKDSDGSWTLQGVVSATSNATIEHYTAAVLNTAVTSTTVITPGSNTLANVNPVLINVVGANVTIQGNGTVSQAISANGNGITLTANPAEGQTFEGWFDQNGKSLGTDPSIEVANGTTVTAVFSGETQPTPPEPGTTSVRVYRLYNPYTGEHLYTTSQTESNTLDVAGWDYEGVAWVAPSSSTIPVYRLFNRYSNDHYYTTSTHEMNVLKGEGWTVDFGGAPAFYSATSSSVPVYCLFNPYVTTNTHLFTADYNEYTIRGGQGWRQQGPSFYALSLN